jgi:hypothetical protein
MAIAAASCVANQSANRVWQMFTVHSRLRRRWGSHKLAARHREGAVATPRAVGLAVAQSAVMSRRARRGAMNQQLMENNRK